MSFKGRLKDAADVAWMVVASQLLAPAMAFDVPSLGRLTVVRWNHRPRGMYSNDFEYYMHGLDGELAETPEQFNVMGRTGRGDMWRLGIDLERKIVGHADMIDHGHDLGSAAIGVFVAGLPGLIVSLPLIVPWYVARGILRLVTRMDAHTWVAWMKVRGQLPERWRGPVRQALLNRFNGVEEAQSRRMEIERCVQRSIGEDDELQHARLTYMDRLGRGEVANIHDEIEAWHRWCQWPSRHQDVKLHEYLGMTWEEYSAWVEGRKSPQQILDDRQAAKDDEYARRLRLDEDECCDDH